MIARFELAGHFDMIAIAVHELTSLSAFRCRGRLLQAGIDDGRRTAEPLHSGKNLMDVKSCRKEQFIAALWPVFSRGCLVSQWGHL